MLPILFKIEFVTPVMQVVGVIISIGLVGYGYWSGWRGADTRQNALYRALPFAAFAGLVALVGASYMGPRFSPTAEAILKALTWGFSIALTITATLYGRKVNELWYGGLGVAAGILAIKFGLYDGAIGRGMGAPLHTYGLMMATAFASAFWMCAREAPRAYPENVKLEGGKTEPLGPIMRDRILDLGFYVILGGLIGSRILFVITKWDEYRRDWSQMFSLSGGLVFYGGFIGAGAVVIWYCREHKLEFLRIADVIIPSVALAHAIGRVGCLSAGCCWGGIAKTGSWLAVRFPSAGKLGALNFGTDALAYSDQAKDDRWVDSLGHLYNHAAAGTQHIKEVALSTGYSLPVYPTQLMESVGELSLFLLLLFVRRGKRFNGQVIATWLMLYAILRFCLELFRGDDIRNFLFKYPDEIHPVILSTSQTISLLMFITGAAVFVVYGRKAMAAAKATA